MVYSIKSSRICDFNYSMKTYPLFNSRLLGKGTVNIKHIFLGRLPAGIYMFKVNNRNTRTRCEICSKLTITTLEQLHWRRSGVFIVNFKHISHLGVSIVNCELVNAGWVRVSRTFLLNVRVIVKTKESDIIATYFNDNSSTREKTRIFFRFHCV